MFLSKQYGTTYDNAELITLKGNNVYNTPASLFQTLET